MRNNVYGGSSNMMRGAIIKISAVVVTLLLSSLIAPTFFNDNDRADPAEIGSSFRSEGMNGEGPITRSQTPARETNESDPWPMFKKDIRNSGYQNDTSYNNSGYLRWKTRIPGTITRSSPIICNNSLYIGSTSSTSNSTKALYCLDLKGDIKWKFFTTGGIYGTPALIKNMLIFTTIDGFLYSLSNNGTLIWKKYIGGILTSSPLIKNNTIYFGSSDGYIYSYLLNGSLYKKYLTNDGIDSSPCIDESGNIYFGSKDNNLYCLYPNFTLKWKHQTQLDIAFSSPCIGNNGKIYIGSYDGNLYCIDKTGKEDWKYSTGDYISSSPSVDGDGNIIFGSEDNGVYSLTKSGELNWKYLTGDAIWSSPAIDGNSNIYIGSVDSKIYSFFPDGELKWAYKTKDYVYSSPSIDYNGNVYIGSYDGYLYSIGNIPPSEPIITSTKSGNGHVSFEWDSPADDGGAEILGYRIYRNSTGNGSYHTLLHEFAGNAFSFNDTELTNGLNYSYYLTAFNREGEGDRTSFYNFTPRGPPSAPLNLSFSLGAGLVNILWEAPLNDGGYPIEQYRIYRSENATFYLLGTSEKLYFEDFTGSPGTNYSYYVTAVNSFGEGDPSLIDWVITIGAPPPPMPITIGRFDGEISFNWSMTIPYLETFYVTTINIYRNGTRLASLPISDIHYNDTGLTNGVNYSYRLSSENNLTESELSDEIVVAPSWIPTPPRNLSAWANSTTVKLNWEPPRDERGMPVMIYDVYRRKPGDEWTRVMILDMLSWTDPYVEKGVAYAYAVKAGNNRGSSVFSNSATVTIPEGDPPGTTTNLSIKINEESGFVQLEWDPAENDSSYHQFNIFRSQNENLDSFRVRGQTTTLEYRDGVDSNTTYYYYVKAENEYGQSLPTEIVSITVPYIPEGDDDDDINVSDDDDDDTTENEFSIWVLVIAAILLSVIIAVIILVVVLKRRGNEINEPEMKIEGVDPTPEDPELSIEDELETLTSEGQDEIPNDTGIPLSDEPITEEEPASSNEMQPPEVTEGDPEIENEEGSPELTEEQVREIEEARDRIEEGNYITEEEASGSLGLDRN